MKAPKCRICQQEHWLNVGCDGKPHAAYRERPTEPGAPAPAASRNGGRAGPRSKKRRKKK